MSVCVCVGSGFIVIDNLFVWAIDSLLAIFLLCGDKFALLQGSLDLIISDRLGYNKLDSQTFGLQAHTFASLVSLDDHEWLMEAKGLRRL